MRQQRHRQLAGVRIEGQREMSSFRVPKTSCGPWWDDFLHPVGIPTRVPRVPGVRLSAYGSLATASYEATGAFSPSKGSTRTNCTYPGYCTVVDPRALLYWNQHPLATQIGMPYIRKHGTDFSTSVRGKYRHGMPDRVETVRFASPNRGTKPEIGMLLGKHLYSERCTATQIVRKH
eukprot:2482081-Rhodomonas_salina.1